MIYRDNFSVVVFLVLSNELLSPLTSNTTPEEILMCMKIPAVRRQKNYKFIVTSSSFQQTF